MDSNFFSSSSPSGEQRKICNFKKFFIVKLEEGSFSHVSPFLIQKSLQSMVGEVSSVRKIKSDDLMVEVSSKQQAESISKCTSFGTLAVSVLPHSKLNTSRGVISETDLSYISESEILDRLKEQNIIDVRRITIRCDGKVLPTKHLVLTFDSPFVPTRIKARYLSCSIRPFIPNPLRCFKCQRFGHAKDNCRGTVTCARCAQIGHESDTCEAPYKCKNCAGDHPSYSRLCSKWIAEKEIQNIKTTNKLPYSEACKIVESRAPTVGKSYAAATSSKVTKSVGTQTNSTGTQTDLPSRIDMQNVNTSNIHTTANLKPCIISQSKNPVLAAKSQLPKLCAPTTSKLTSNLNANLLPAKTQIIKSIQSPGSVKAKKSTPLTKSSEKRTKKISNKSASSQPINTKKFRDHFLKNSIALQKITEDELDLYTSDLSDNDVEFTDINHKSTLIPPVLSHRGLT